jgi:hypothetical protein
LDDELPVLFADFVRPFARCVLGRLDPLPSLAAQNADEAAYGVRLPVRRFHDLPERRALRAFIIATSSAFLLVPSVFGLPTGFLDRAVFFAGLAFFLSLRPAFGCVASDAGLMLSIAFSLIEFLLDRVAVVTWIALVRRNGKQNL